MKWPLKPDLSLVESPRKRSKNPWERRLPLTVAWFWPFWTPPRGPNVRFRPVLPGFWEVKGKMWEKGEKSGSKTEPLFVKSEKRENRKIENRNSILFLLRKIVLLSETIWSRRSQWKTNTSFAKVEKWTPNGDRRRSLRKTVLVVLTGDLLRERGKRKSRFSKIEKVKWCSEISISKWNLNSITFAAQKSLTL